MSNIKYKCKDCGEIFEGNYSTMFCPRCGSTNIVQVKSLLPLWILLGVLAVAALVALLLWLPAKTNALHAQLIPDDEVKGVKIAILHCTPEELQKNYKVIAFEEDRADNIIERTFNGAENSVIFFFRNLRDGVRYTFQVYSLSDDNMQNVEWAGGIDYYDMPKEEPSNGGDCFIDKYETEHKKNRKNHTYTVTVKVLKHSGDCTSFIYKRENGEPNADNVFRDVPPGDFTFYVNNQEFGVTLPEFSDNLHDPVTRQQVQEAIDNASRISRSRKTIGDLCKNITCENDPSIKTLTALLTRANQGERFDVVSMEIDEETNEVKNGTLVVRKR